MLMTHHQVLTSRPSNQHKQSQNLSVQQSNLLKEKKALNSLCFSCPFWTEHATARTTMSTDQASLWATCFARQAEGQKKAFVGLQQLACAEADKPLLSTAFDFDISNSGPTRLKFGHPSQQSQKQRQPSKCHAATIRKHTLLPLSSRIRWGNYSLTMSHQILTCQVTCKSKDPCWSIPNSLSKPLVAHRKTCFLWLVIFQQGKRRGSINTCGQHILMVPAFWSSISRWEIKVEALLNWKESIMCPLWGVSCSMLFLAK